jgi:hypothetical protein
MRIITLVSREHPLKLNWLDGFRGTTDIAWAVKNQHLVQLFFIRPDRTSAEASHCWDLISHKSEN